MIGTTNTEKETTTMTKEEAISILIKELVDRLPKDNKEGFLADECVYEAMMILKEYHEELAEFEEKK